MKKTEKNNIIPFRTDPEIYFRIGVRNADKKSYKNALKYLEKAVELEPYNADFRFNLAGVLAELHETERSNEVLLYILKNIDPTLTECYFGIGCNYFDMEDYKKAREYFERYMYFEPEGSFSDEVYDVLQYLQVYEEMGADSKRSKRAKKLYDKGLELIAEGMYQKAAEKLESAIELEPDLTMPRNDLSLVCFLMGDTGKAVALANSVLKLDPEDLWANCNLALYYRHGGKRALFRHIMKVLSGLELNLEQEVLKLLDTYIKLREYENIKNIPYSYNDGLQEAVKIISAAAARDYPEDHMLMEVVTGLKHMAGEKILPKGQK